MSNKTTRMSRHVARTNAALGKPDTKISDWNDPEQHRCHHSCWQGPLKDGVSLQMIKDFIICRERFRLRYVHGLRELKPFDPSYVYPLLWKVAIESIARKRNPMQDIDTFISSLVEYRDNASEMAQLAYICKSQINKFIHIRMARSNPNDNKIRCYSVPCELPSGRRIILRGKFDTADTQAHNSQLHPTRNPSECLRYKVSVSEVIDIHEIDPEVFNKTVQYNLPFMFNHFVMQSASNCPGHPLNSPMVGPYAIDYYYVKRPLSDRFPIKRKKSETIKEFLNRVVVRINNEPEDFFKLMGEHISHSQYDNFQHRCIYPILEQICDWWELIHGSIDFSPDNRGIHYVTPWGIQPLLGGGFGGDFPAMLKGEKFKHSSITSDPFDESITAFMDS